MARTTLINERIGETPIDWTQFTVSIGLVNFFKENKKIIARNHLKIGGSGIRRNRLILSAQMDVSSDIYKILPSAQTHGIECPWISGR